jgi:hypothetical protein
VHEAIASAVFSFHHLPGEINPAKILSKHWSYQKLWRGMFQPLLFHSGNTANLIDDEE